MAKKLNIGLYEFTHKGRRFQVEDIKRASDGDCVAGWMAYEVTESESGERREYLNDYGTKRAAMATTIAAVDAGY